MRFCIALPPFLKWLFLDRVILQGPYCLLQWKPGWVHINTGTLKVAIFLYRVRMMRLLTLSGGLKDKWPFLCIFWILLLPTVFLLPSLSFHPLENEQWKGKRRRHINEFMEFTSIILSFKKTWKLVSVFVYLFKE